MQKQFCSKKQSRKNAQVLLLSFLGVWMYKTIFCHCLLFSYVLFFLCLFVFNKKCLLGGQSSQLLVPIFRAFVSFELLVKKFSLKI